MTRQPRVYFAASLFNEGERAFNRQVVDMIHELGYSTWFPQEDVGLLSDMLDKGGMTMEEAREHIFRLNIKEVQAADLVVFVLDGRVPDEGACIEAGIAWGMDKQVIGLKTDFRDGEPGGNNIMIDGIATHVAGSIDELRSLLEPTHTLVDLTGSEPVVTVRTAEPTTERATESTTPRSSK